MKKLLLSFVFLSMCSCKTLTMPQAVNDLTAKYDVRPGVLPYPGGGWIGPVVVTPKQEVEVAK